MRVSPGWIETEAAIRLTERIARDSGTDPAGGRELVMKSLGGILAADDSGRGTRLESLGQSSKFRVDRFGRLSYFHPTGG